MDNEIVILHKYAHIYTQGNIPMSKNKCIAAKITLVIKQERTKWSKFSK